MFRSATVALKPLTPSNAFLTAATDLLARYQWRATGICVVDSDRLSPPEPVPLGGTAAKAHRDEVKIREAREGAVRVTAEFERSAGAKSISGTTKILEGDVPQVLAEETVYSDVLICGHTAGGDASERSLLFSILKQNVRPAIVLPAHFQPGESVLVAYDGSAQAARALASLAHSGIAEDRRVHLLSLHEDHLRAERLAERAATYLATHGISAIPSGKELSADIASQILNEASAVRAELLVLGAFGKSAIREFFFGSVTRSILQTLPLPLLLNH